MYTIDINSLLDHWNAAIQTGKPKNVVALYDINAILLPTISNKIRKTHAEIEDYFEAFLDKRPKGVLTNPTSEFLVISRSTRAFILTFANGHPQARFTFVYRFNVKVIKSSSTTAQCQSKRP